jgi:hypothetical protein
MGRAGAATLRDFRLGQLYAGRAPLHVVLFDVDEVLERSKQ